MGQCRALVCVDGDSLRVQVLLLWTCVGHVANHLEHSLRQGYHPGLAKCLPCPLFGLMAAYGSVLCACVSMATH
jgi:hypothetical protein